LRVAAKREASPIRTARTAARSTGSTQSAARTAALSAGAATKTTAARSARTTVAHFLHLLLLLVGEDLVELFVDFLLQRVERLLLRVAQLECFRQDRGEYGAGLRRPEAAAPATGPARSTATAAARTLTTRPAGALATWALAPGAVVSEFLRQRFELLLRDDTIV